MRKILFGLSSLLLFSCSSHVWARDLNVNVLLDGEVRPGVYGRIELGNSPPPMVVYERPQVIVTNRYHHYEEPIYLHVPPEHSRHWAQHCSYYDACNRPVYFVRSEEYEPEYQSREHERRENRRDHDSDEHHRDHDRDDDRDDRNR